MVWYGTKNHSDEEKGIMEKIKVCLIGCGRAGMIHARSYAGNVKRAELIALCDPFEENLRLAREEIEVPCIYTDYREAL